ncbi:L7Ae/L30e/S12e/Gadd45 family ribosomal protein [Aminipila sp.]|uniref:L7Ae/L30e/S12e/Gadd45 family ribosomal protein n=1 Tax=Aminipila sp. TaxID=2060095 RepID=UPI0028A0AF27|nr:ribosomal L7Ae/L30e/S12e/Gadd45 family protein [Aminipila sp.]
MRKKIDSYLGFAKRSRNLIMGYNTCLLSMSKKKLKLLILASDVSENTMKKLVNAAIEWKVVYRIYGTCDELSQACGTTGRGVFGITDQNFANVILKEIDEDQSI